MDARDAVQRMMLFRGVDPLDADALAAIAEPQAYAAGEHLFDQLHPADALFAIFIGMVELTRRGRSSPIVTVGSGQSLGDLAFFERDNYGASAYAREATRVLRIPFDGLDRLIAERPAWRWSSTATPRDQFAHHLRQLAAERDRPYSEAAERPPVHATSGAGHAASHAALTELARHLTRQLFAVEHGLLALEAPLAVPQLHRHQAGQQNGRKELPDQGLQHRQRARERLDRRHVAVADGGQGGEAEVEEALHRVGVHRRERALFMKRAGHVHVDPGDTPRQRSWR